ncbi:tetratricopeptide repeat protein [Acinetobacter lanii]|uniref:SEL1-like repeat protein n=1 Tax=Acinetobacter lanii TaxID=2715163 RepID=A0A6G8S556_9GAMM|nr:SEL1-like repeat protein [Acinetobacter lanii]QIO09158.1 SEL1-like repeat protein [Acinetobacter lanii]
MKKILALIFLLHLALIVHADEEYFKSMLESAKEGDSFSQFYVGYAYDQGEEVEQNHKNAIEWYRKSADQGETRAIKNLAIKYANGEGVDQNYAEAKKIILKNANQDLIESINLLVDWLIIPNTPIYNPNEAFLWATKSLEIEKNPTSAQFGGTVAKYLLGKLYDYGIGVSPDPKKAIALYRLSAKDDYSDAQFALGYLYHKGKGVKKDITQAIDWYNKAADQNDSDALLNLGYIYLTEDDYLDEQNAAHYLHAASEQNNPNAHYILGILFEEGRGVDKNVETAYEYYEKAVQVNSELALDAIAKLLDRNKILKNAKQSDLDQWIEYAEQLQNPTLKANFEKLKL